MVIRRARVERNLQDSIESVCVGGCGVVCAK